MQFIDIYIGCGTFAAAFDGNVAVAVLIIDVVVVAPVNKRSNSDRNKKGDNIIRHIQSAD